jgi:hypothetical protein
MSGNTKTTMRGTQVLKNLGCPKGDKIHIQNEVGREMGCGVGDPPYAKKEEVPKIHISHKQLNLFYTRGLGIVVSHVMVPLP